MRRALALLVLLCAAPALAVPVPVGRLGTTLHAGTDPRDPMPTERSDAARTGRLRGTLPRAEPRVSFDVALEAAHPRGPIVDREGRIFVGTAHGLVGLSSSGEILLDLRIGPIDVAPALLPSGDLLVATRELALLVVRPSGDVIARTTLPAAIRAAPLVLDDGSVVLAAVDRRILHLGSDLLPRATVILDEGPSTSPTLAASGRVVVGAGTTLHVFDPERGTIVERIALGARAVGAAVRGARGELYQLLNDATVVRIDDESALGLRIPLRGEGETGRAFDANTLALAPDGSLRVTLPSRGVIALGPDADGAWAVRWTYTTDAPFYGSVAVDESGCAIATDRRGRLTVLDEAGALLFRVELGVPIAVPAIVGHTLVVATDRPAVMAFEIP
jgi:outer membrane protein assembly factor BamB